MMTGIGMRSYKPVVFTLATLSIVPLLFATYLSLAHESFLGKSGITLFATYGAIVLSFLGGASWGRVIEQPEYKNGKKLLISAYFTMSAAWVSLLFITPELSVAFLLLGLITIFWVEVRWLKQPNTDKSYHFSLHFGLTSLASILHLLVLYPHY
jgi:hypothetical protein